jgi:ParB family chromosome partitioning protein
MSNKNKAKDLLNQRMNAGHFGTPQAVRRISVIELERITPNPDNPRKTFDQDTLNELAQSIDRNGLMQPIVVKKHEDDKYIIVAGERRFRAHQQLQKKNIEVIITEGDIEELALVENLQREDLKPMEAAESLDKLMKTHGYTQEEVARAVGKARTTVTELLSLVKLPEHIRIACRPADISRSFLVELARMEPEQQEAAWQNYLETGSTKRADIRAMRGEKRAARVGEPKPEDTPFQKVERALWIAFKTLEGAKDTLSREETEKILTIKSTLDKLVATMQPKQPEVNNPEQGASH